MTVEAPKAVGKKSESRWPAVLLLAFLAWIVFALIFSIMGGSSTRPERPGDESLPQDGEVIR